MRNVLIYLGVSILFSCTSEYQESLKKANTLQKEYQQLENLHRDSQNIYVLERMYEIEKEIKILAEISGNKTLFLKNFSFINS